MSLRNLLLNTYHEFVFQFPLFIETICCKYKHWAMLIRLAWDNSVDYSLKIYILNDRCTDSVTLYGIRISSEEPDISKHSYLNEKWNFSFKRITSNICRTFFLWQTLKLIIADRPPIFLWILKLTTFLDKFHWFPLISCMSCYFWHSCT